MFWEEIFTAMKNKISLCFGLLSYFNDKYFIFIAYVYKFLMGVFLLGAVFYRIEKTSEGIIMFLIPIGILCILLLLALKYEKYNDILSLLQNIIVILYVGEYCFSSKTVVFETQNHNVLIFLIVSILNENYSKIPLKILYFMIVFAYIEIRIIQEDHSVIILVELFFLLLYSIYHSWFICKTLKEEKQVFNENKEFISLYEEIIKNYPSTLISFEKTSLRSNDFPFELRFFNDSAKKEFKIHDNTSLSQLLEDVHINTDDLLNFDLPQDLSPSIPFHDLGIQDKRLLDTCVCHDEYDFYEKNGSTTIKKFLTSYNPRKESPTKDEENSLNYRVFIVRFCFKKKLTFLLNIENINLEEEIMHLRQMDKVKDDTLASITHDLRSPLSSMLKWIEYAKESSNIYENHKNLELATNNGNMLMSLINDILDYSLIKNGKFKLNYTKFSLETLVQECINLMKIQADFKEISLKAQFKCPKSLHITSDFTRIKQIIYNLIGNSIKFTKKFGEINLSISLISSEKNLLKFSVSDNGIGIKPDIIPKLCQPFHSYDYSGNFNKQGVGLGLHICKTIVGQLGPKNEIDIESVFEKGSNFTFIIYINCLQAANKSKFITSDQLMDLHNKKIEEQIIKSNKDFLLEIASYHSKDNISDDFIEAKSIKNVPYFKENTLNEHGIDDMVKLNDKDTILEIDSKDINIQSQNLINNNKNNEIFAQNNLNAPFSDQKLHIQRTPKLILDGIIRILIVDDDPFILMIMTTIFSKFKTEFGASNISIEQAFNGEEAIKLFENHNYSLSNNPFDVIFMDCLMPIKDGFAATQILRDLIHDKQFQNCKIIGCTAFQDQEKCILSGMNEILIKPVENEKVFEILRLIYYEKFKI